MNHIHNFFPVKGAAITGKITIGEWIFDTHTDVTADAKDLRYSDTAIRLPLQDGQYYLISGSIFNDGVYQYHKGDTAPKAAGVIHTDFERGFIRAQTIAYDDYIKYNGEKGAQEAGKERAEGKDYVVHDGDIMNFLFNV